MISDRSGNGRRQVKKTGKHRKPAKQRSVLTRTVAAGGAAVAIGVAYEVSTPLADALSIVFHDGKGNATQLNIVEGNIFDPQLGMSGANVSDNETYGGVVVNGDLEKGTPNQIKGVLGNSRILRALTDLWSREIVIGNAAGGVSNVTQVNLFSYNIFNPQVSPNGNTSSNLAISNAAVGMGNNATTQMASTGLASVFLGGMAGNGNATQLAFFSGNIFNPQFSLNGPNNANNTGITNAAIQNGNNSSTAVTGTGGLGTLTGGMTGNGNSTQFAGFATNIFNPQFNLSGTNASNNTAATNTGSGNGNDSDNEVTSGGGGNAILGTNGNGTSTQGSTGTGNIFNDQFRFGMGTPPTGTAGTTGSNPTNPVAKRIKDAVDNALRRNQASSNPPGNGAPSTGDAE
jgi:hypothetical protein